MSATERARRLPVRRHARESGVAAIEVALLASVFFTLVFGVMELARAVYVFNTMFEATRYAARAAATTSHRDGDTLDRIRQRAMFRASPGNLVFGAPVNDGNVKFDYLALTRAADGSMSLDEIPAGSLPATARQNREICMTNPNAANCIRFVRARICAETGVTDCDQAVFRPILPMLSFWFRVPRATTVRPVESFGSMPGVTPAP
ncbi:TadE family protein [Telluria beijingensis]|uniref:TadE family protein n=1 Tax=Telluria beijingensis TaxID=3068633 RepID=UPI0027956E50|nr:TadE family protein [Massilia sp. REN29]